MIKRNTMLTYIMADHLLIFHSLHGVSSSPKYVKKNYLGGEVSRELLIFRVFLIFCHFLLYVEITPSQKLPFANPECKS